MTAINHHLDEATILAFAAGTLPEAHGFVAATHLAFCTQCRASVHQAEELGGAILADETASAVSDNCRAATLASLAELPSAPTKVAANEPRGDVPAVLCNLIGKVPLAELKWKKKAPGVSAFEVPLSSGGASRLQLLKIGPGRAMPEHGHGGEEITLVLRGSYRDHMGRFAAGDVADLDEAIEHQPVVDSEVDCICLVATEAPTRFKSLWARLAQPFVGI